MLITNSVQFQDLSFTCLDSQFLDEIHQVYVQAYRYLGLPVSEFSGDELKSKYDGVLSYQDEAFFVYLNTPFGQKISLLFSRPSAKAKRLLVEKYLELIQQDNWYIEASARIEQISRKAHIPHLNKREDIELVLQKKVWWLGRGYYRRQLSKSQKWVTKKIYGKPLLFATYH
jgi:hypothetical protein